MQHTYSFLFNIIFDLMRSSAFREISFRLRVSPTQNNFRGGFCFPRWLLLSQMAFAFQISLLAIMDIIDIIGIIDHNGHYGRLCPLCPMKSIKSILETYFLLRNQLLFPKGIFFPEIDLESKLI